MKITVSLSRYLRSETGAQFLKYSICGIATVTFYVGGVSVMTRATPFSDLWINSVFYALATVLGYTLNYFWSFQSTGQHRTAFTKYLAVAAVGVGLNFLAVRFMISKIGLSVTLSAFIFSAVWPIVSFAAQKYFVYRA